MRGKDFKLYILIQIDKSHSHYTVGIWSELIMFDIEPQAIEYYLRIKACIITIKVGFFSDQGVDDRKLPRLDKLWCWD
jgi:hypothetical protein